jgi:two-component system, OmpR family, response regulator
MSSTDAMTLCDAGRSMFDTTSELENLDILIVDDDAELRREMADYLAGHGLKVHQAGDARQAREVLAAQAIRLVVLDVMMPGEDGLSLCRKLAEGGGPPVLMLSAMGESVDRIVGLELGADDYVAKPAPPRELLARIRAILRRRAADPQSTSGGANYAFAGFRLDLTRRQLRAPDGMVLQLTPAELSLLTVFVRNPGRILSRDELLREARGEDIDVNDRAVDVHISRLRRKMHAQTSGELIRTYRAAGYMLDARVSPA